MATTGPPIRPRRIDERAYEVELRKQVLQPMLREAQRRIDAAGHSYEAIREAIKRIGEDPQLAGLSEEAARSQFQRILTWHKQRFHKAMQRFFGVRLELLRDTPIDLDARVADNVRLIRTIPERFHAGLAEKIVELETAAPFDESRLRSTLRREYQSSGYNLRRLTRDQTSKLVGQLNHARQTELGISQYQWLTSQDERVRPSHVANSGMIFSWDAPPEATGHPGSDVMCRCVAVPLIGEDEPSRVRGPSSIIRMG